MREVWRVETPTDDNKLRPDQRLVTVQKSRIGRVNERLLQVQNDDLTVEMVEWQNLMRSRQRLALSANGFFSGCWFPTSQ